MEENYVMQKLMSYVSEIFSTTKIEDYYGLSRSLKILNHVNNCIILENIKDKNYVLALRCASILHNIDNKQFFSKNNSKVILDSLFGNRSDNIIIQKILKLIHNPGTLTVSPDKEWMLIPRYAHMLECLGEPGLIRLYFYYCFYDKNIIPKKGSLKDIDYYNSEEFLDNCVYENMIEHYLSFYRYKQYLEKCNIPYVIKIARERCEFMKKYLIMVSVKKFNAEHLIKLKKNIEKKKLL